VYDRLRRMQVVSFTSLDELLDQPTCDYAEQVADRMEAAALLAAMKPGQQRAVWRVYAGYQQDSSALKMHLHRARKLARMLRDTGAA
jgi:hypothetical protein